MQRTSPIVITGWKMWLLLPLILPLGLVSQWLGKKGGADRTPEDVAGFIGDFLDGTGGDWDWDEFESVPIKDPELEAIRQRAVLCAPPAPDMAGLRVLLTEVQELSRNRAMSPQPDPAAP